MENLCFGYFIPLVVLALPLAHVVVFAIEGIVAAILGIVYNRRNAINI